MAKIQFNTDKDFDSLLSESIRKQSEIHWTPLHIIEQSIEFFNEHSCSHLLDIGSGAGKFCLIGGTLTNAQLTGVEIRKHLHLQAFALKKDLGLNHVHLINKNIIEIDFSTFDGFYYFNPFFENIEEEGRIDHSLNYKTEQYHLYTNHVKKELDALKSGTCLVTYWTSEASIPESFQLIEEQSNLCFWKKL